MNKHKLSDINPGKALNLLSLALFLLIFSFSANAVGLVDSTFNASAYSISGGGVTSVLHQPDGRIVIGGRFTSVGTEGREGVARINPDGTVDTTFNSASFYGPQGVGSGINALGLQSDGKIIVGGTFFSTDAGSSGSSGYLKRLNADGTLDASFPTSVLGGVYHLTIQPDNKIIVSGNFNFTGTSGIGIARLNANGTIDGSFSPVAAGASCSGCAFGGVYLQPDGKILYTGNPSGGNQTLVRLNPNGTVDESFAPSVSVSAEVIRVQSDGKILVGGEFSAINGFTENSIARLNTDGSLDLTFNTNNSGATASTGFHKIWDIAIDGSGSIFITGKFDSYNGVARKGIAKLNSDGTLDASFNFAGNRIVNGYDIDILPDGRIALGFVSNGSVAAPADPDSFAILSSTGVPATAPTIGMVAYANKVLQQPDGKVLAGGFFLRASGLPATNLARFNSDGSLDISFSSASGGQKVTGLALQPDGKILVGIENQPYLRRLNTDGTLDGTFDATNSLTSSARVINVLPDGRILAGNVMLLPNGSKDLSFTFASLTGGSYLKVTLLPDGKFLIAGTFTAVSGAGRGRVARLNSDGSLDTSFNPPGGANGRVNDVRQAPDGKIVIGGEFTAVNGSNAQSGVGRFNSDGSLDTTFAANAGFAPLVIVVQNNRKIIAGGQASNGIILELGRVVRFNVSGSIDNNMNVWASYPVLDLSLQSDGKILVAGDFNKIDGTPHVSVARLNSANRSAFDFDGDGRSDLGVFRGSSGFWYLMQSANGESIQPFGTSGDRVAAADYDGDGKSDLAVYRDGAWWYINSGSGSLGLKNWGTTNDTPLPSDFDGDGKADFIYYRPTTGEWFRSGSTGVNSTIQFGIAGDIPVIADMDGDDKTDPTVFRPSTGTWWYHSSVTGADTPVQWGQNGDVPVTGDYDGDGKTDAAVWRPSNGAWYVLNSGSGSISIVSWGLSGDKPVAADYDGDGKADVAIYRPSTGVWYILQSTAGFTGMQYGISTDKPVQNAFLP